MSLLTADIDAEVEKKGEDLTTKEIAAVAEFVGDVRKSRLEWEVDCFVNEMMKKGRQYVNDKGRNDVRDSHQLRRIVNKFRTMLRRMKNSITFNDPVIDVLPEVGKEEEATPEQLDMASWLCLREYKQNNWPTLIKQAVETAALKTWALVSVTPNDGDDYQERLTRAQTFDSLDVFFDTPDMSSAHLLVISSLEDKVKLEAQGFDLKGVGDSTASSHSHSKTRLDAISGKQVYKDKFLIDQVFAIEYDRDDAGKLKLDTKKVVHYVVCGDKALTPKKVLKDYTCLDEMFYVLYLEQDQFDSYNPPWMSDVVPLQRSLNDASENTDTILSSYAKTRWKQRMGDSSDISVLQNKHMQLIRYDGAAPEPVDMPNPPQALFEMMALRSQQIEDQVGQHGASMGIKEGTQSGRHAALIQAGDQDNMKEPADNLELLLNWAFEQVLDIGSKNLDKVTRMYSPDDEGREGYIVGEAFVESMNEEDKGKNPISIRAFKNIRTAVFPGSFFTLAQAKSDYLELLPILNNLGMKTEAKALWKVMMRTMNAGLSRNIARLVDHEEKAIQVENADWVIAEQEFLKMTNGEEVMATPQQDHDVHLQVKVPGVQAIIQRYGQDNDAVWLIMKNIQQHYQMQQQKQGNAPEAAGAIETAMMEGGGAPVMPPEGPAPAPAMAAPGAELPLPV